MPAVFKGMVGTWRTSQQRHEVCYLWRCMQRDLLFFMHTYYTILNWQVFVFWLASPRHCLTFMICSLDSQNKKRTCLREKTWSIHIRRRFPDPGSRQLQYWKRWQYFTANIGSEGAYAHLRSKSVQKSSGGPFGKYDIFAHKRLQRQLAHSSLPLVCLAWRGEGGQSAFTLLTFIHNGG